MCNNPVLKVFEHVHKRSVPLDVLLYFYHNVASMAVCMNKIMLHEHFKKHARSYHRDGFVKFMRMLYKKSNRDSFCKRLYKDFIVGLGIRLWEFYIWIFKYSVVFL